MTKRRGIRVIAVVVTILGVYALSFLWCVRITRGTLALDDQPLPRRPIFVTLNPTVNRAFGVLYWPAIRALEAKCPHWEYTADPAAYGYKGVPSWHCSLLFYTRDLMPIWVPCVAGVLFCGAMGILCVDGGAYLRRRSLRKERGTGCE